ncbi:hypothetical protein [Halomonas elongata]|uniref:Uncharacterized protein n=1 Tax=Halomonas elongata (strain ATCC 33173 / DSM 2581 / NBRC 15536 / NCIMB 2198 / 1H9) TaxID=768066 RepID=A0A1R4A4J5_HALED|nr:hypothetical protein [Halomonas elongata]WBF18051.1 hypothetical protein LM502_18630 [Halomonas elongata]WPU46901.1 hypothetical protein SR933_16875 [Halomonas elongata DSM 2581]SJK83898.1 uncharacterized protein HELO_4398B [Halomonas elongata DSM 2581]
MSRKIAFPFLTLPDQVVKTGEWMIGDVGEPLFPCNTFLDFWDYDRDLEVALELCVDLPAASEVLDLGSDDLELIALLKVGTGMGSTPRTILHSSLVAVDESEGRAMLAAKLDGSRLSSRLWLEASLVLAAEPRSPGKLSPCQPGARLWSSSINVLLEDGGDSRLPMEAVPFSQIFKDRRHEDALWYLDWRPSAWDSDFAGSVRLYLNKDRETFLQKVLDGDPFYLHMIMADVMLQLVSAYIRSDVSDSPHDHGEGSLARQTHDWLILAFPGLSVHAARTLLHDKPGDFHAAIHAAAAVEDEA